MRSLFVAHRRQELKQNDPVIFKMTDEASFLTEVLKLILVSCVKTRNKPAHVTVLINIFK